METVILTSLEKFQWIVETQYPEIKKYIQSENEYHVIIEDTMGDKIFGSNKDLEVLYNNPSIFPIKKISTSYKEKDCCFVVKIDLK